MVRTVGQKAVSRLWLGLTVFSLLVPVLLCLGCRKQEEAPATSGGTVYYKGPMKPKGSPTGNAPGAGR
jgi:hypothetical protein